MGQKNPGVYEYLKAYAEERGEERFMVMEEDSFNVRECLKICEILMEEQKGLGVHPGDQVWMPAENSAKWILRFLALQCSGAVTILAEKGEEPGVDAAQGISWILREDKLRPFGETANREYKEKKPEPEQAMNCQDATILLFTSGSSGTKKLVRLSQSNFIENSLDTKERGGYRPDDLNLLLVPVHHVFGIALIVTAIVLQHAIFIPARRQPEHTADCIRRFGITRMNGVPSMYFALAEQAKKAPMPSLRCGLIGGGPCTTEQFCMTEESLGMTLIPVYGMSECIGISCGDYKDSLHRRSIGVGKPYSKNQVIISENGEVLVKSPAQFLGYENREDSEILNSEGFVQTGDLGCFDEDGYLCLTGRKKELIIRGGENVSPQKIETILLDFPEVALAAVVRAEDDHWGEVPHAFVVLKGVCPEKQKETRTGIERYLSRHLKSYELPRYITILQEMPLTATGKIDKQSLRKQTLSA